MWTAAISQLTGQPDVGGTTQKLTFNNNLQQLRQMFWQRNALGSIQGQLIRRWYITQQGTPTIVAATAMGEIAGTMEPTMNSRLDASFAVDLLLADPYFYGANQTAAITTSGGTIINLGEGVVGEGYPSLVNAFTIQLSSGPVTVSNTTAGVSLTFGIPIASAPVTVDILNQTVIDAAGNNLVGNLTHSGARMWMALLSGTNAITVSNGTATFSWMPPYV